MFRSEWSKLVYEEIKSEFINDVNLNMIGNKIYERYRKFFGRTTESQLNSWKNSMQYMRGVLDDNEDQSLVSL